MHARFLLERLGYHKLPASVKGKDRALARRVLALFQQYLKEGPR